MPTGQATNETTERLVKWPIFRCLRCNRIAPARYATFQFAFEGECDPSLNPGMNGTPEHWQEFRIYKDGIETQHAMCNVCVGSVRGT